MSEEKETSELSFGVVCFIKGDLAGSLGYYDDDEGEEAIVYLGVPFHSDYVVATIDYLREATRDEQIDFEMQFTSALDHDLRDHMGI